MLVGDEIWQWRVFENDEAEVRLLVDVCMETRRKWYVFIIYESGSYVEMVYDFLRFCTLYLRPIFTHHLMV